MEIYEGMLVKDALFYLEKKYSIKCFGRIKRLVDNIEVPTNKPLKLKGSNYTIKIDEKTFLKHLERCFSANPSAPIKFVNEIFGVIPRTWTIGQFLSFHREKSKTAEKDKIDVLIALIESAQNFSDIDWVMRCTKKINISIDDMSEKKLRSAITSQSLILNNDQKEILIRKLNEELKI